MTERNNVVHIEQTATWAYSIYVNNKHHWEKNIRWLMNSLLAEDLTILDITAHLQEIVNEKWVWVDFTEVLRKLLVEKLTVSEDEISFDEVTNNTNELLWQIEDKNLRKSIKEEVWKWYWFISYWKFLNSIKKDWETTSEVWERQLSEILDNPDKVIKDYKDAINEERFDEIRWFLESIDQENLDFKKAMDVWEELYKYLDWYESEDWKVKILWFFNTNNANWERNKIWNFDMITLASNITHPVLSNFLTEYLAWFEKRILLKWNWKDKAKNLVKELLWKRNWILRKLKDLSITATRFDIKKMVELELMSSLEEIWTAQEIAAYNSWRELCVEDWSWEFIWETHETHEREVVYPPNVLKAFYNKKTNRFEDPFIAWKDPNVIELWHFWQWTYDKVPLNEITCSRKFRKNPIQWMISDELIKEVY